MVGPTHVWAKFEESQRHGVGPLEFLFLLPQPRGCLCQAHCGPGLDSMVKCPKPGLNERPHLAMNHRSKSQVIGITGKLLLQSIEAEYFVLNNLFPSGLGLHCFTWAGLRPGPYCPPRATARLGPVILISGRPLIFLRRAQTDPWTHLITFFPCGPTSIGSN